jgi:FkbM family methyltransferase
MSYHFTQGANVPGGHYCLMNPTKGKPFVPHIPEAKLLRLDPRDVVVDIGAYCGTYAITAARFPVHQVHAYEPDPRSFSALALTHLPNLTAYRKAVVRETPPHTATFYLSHGIGVRNSLLPSTRKDAIEVEAIRYADAVRGATVVKVDIEGGEYDLPIVQPSLRAILLEFHPKGKEWRDRAQLLIASLLEANFSPLLYPNFKSTGFSYASAWIRPIEMPPQVCDVLLHGLSCLGCGAPLFHGQGKSVCDKCWPHFLPKHRGGLTLAHRRFQSNDEVTHL